MDLKLKAFSAAVLAFAATASHADILDASSGNSELVATIFNKDGDRSSALFDLGIRMDNFLPGSAGAQTVQWFHLGSDPNYAAAWNSIKSAIGSNTVYFSVIALDSVNPRRFLSTSSSDDATVQDQRNLALSNFAQTNAYLTSNNSLGAHATTANGASFATSTGSNNANFNDVNAAQWKGFSTFQTLGAAGTPLPFWLLGTTSVADNQAATTKYIATWNLDGARGDLIYAMDVIFPPAPEPDAWAMLLAGLVTVGVIARRRLNGGLPA